MDDTVSKLQAEKDAMYAYLIKNCVKKQELTGHCVVCNEVEASQTHLKLDLDPTVPDCKDEQPHNIIPQPESESESELNVEGPQTNSITPLFL